MALSRRTRFSLWIVCVFGLVISETAWCCAARFAKRWTWQAVGETSAYFFLTGLITLLITTPADAIRLPPRRSVILITAATAWMSLVAWALLHGRPLSGDMTLAVPVATAALATAAWKAGQSPWAATIVAWSPAAIGPVALPATVVATLLLALTAVFVMMADRRRGLTP